MIRLLPAILCIAVVVMMSTTASYAEIPGTMSYQGHLVDEFGEPVNGFVPMTFLVYDDSTAGVSLWSETHPDVEVTTGAFSVILGSLSVIPDSAFSPTQCWLEIVVGGETINPRTRLTTQPYSYASRSVSGDIETEPGHLSIAAESKGGAFLDFRASPSFAGLALSSTQDDTLLSISSSSGGLSRVVANRDDGEGGTVPLFELQGDPASGGEFSMYAPEGGLYTNNPLFRMSFDAGASEASALEMYDPSDNFYDSPLIRMGVEPSPFIGGRLRLSGANMSAGEDSVVLDQGGLKLFQDGAEVFELFNEGLNLRRAACGSKGMAMTKFNACAMVVEDSASDTLMIANEMGVYMMSTVGIKGSWGAFLTPDSMKMEAGAADGYVLTSDADGVGTWQEATGGSGGNGWIDDGATVRLDTEADKVGIGTDSPNGKLHVYSNDGDEAIYAMSTQGGTGTAGYFQGGERGVHAYVSGGTGYRYGVQGQVGGDDSTYSIGLYGITNQGNVSMGALGHGQNGISGTFGVTGLADGTGNDHVGVRGNASDGDSTNVGVEGLANGTGGMINYGLWSNAWGASSLNCGIYATASGAVTNYAGYFEGDVHITGTLTGGGAGGNSGWTDDGGVVRLTNSSDYVGIGVTNPSENLVVGRDLGTIVDDGNRIVVGDDNVAANTGFVFGEDNDNRGFMYWDVAEDFARLGTKNGGTLYASTITWNNGMVGIGTEYPSRELHVVGDICYTNEIVACSDIRYKKDIETIDNASETLMKLRGVKYNWRQDDFPDYKFDDETHLGFVAQEVRELLPEVVTEDDNGYLSVDYSRLTPILVEALKDMHREKQVQDEKVDQLEQDLRELKAMMEEMRSRLSH